MRPGSNRLLVGGDFFRCSINQKLPKVLRGLSFHSQMKFLSRKFSEIWCKKIRSAHHDIFFLNRYKAHQQDIRRLSAWSRRQSIDSCHPFVLQARNVALTYGQFKKVSTWYSQSRMRNATQCKNRKSRNANTSKISPAAGTYY